MRKNTIISSNLGEGEIMVTPVHEKEKNSIRIIPGTGALKQATFMSPLTNEASTLDKLNEEEGTAIIQDELTVKQHMTNTESTKEMEVTLQLSKRPKSTLDMCVQSDSDDDILNPSGDTLICKCERDPKITFACSNGIKWFKDHLIMGKVRYMQQKNPDVDIDKVVAEEFNKCHKLYKVIKKLQPSKDAANQIDLDIVRTFPWNPYFRRD